MNGDIKRKRNWHKRNNNRLFLKYVDVVRRVVHSCSLEADYVLDKQQQISKMLRQYKKAVKRQRYIK